MQIGRRHGAVGKEGGAHLLGHTATCVCVCVFLKFKTSVCVCVFDGGVAGSNADRNANRTQGRDGGTQRGV